MANGFLTPFRRGSLTGSGTFDPLLDLNRRVNGMFEDLFERGSLPPLAASTGWPQVEIDQRDDQIRVVAELPGVNEDDIDLTIEDGMLTLSGEKRSERKDDSGYSERSYGRFERRISLPSNVDEDKCAADFKNGVLTVTIPRAEEKGRGRRIPLGGSKSNQRIEAQNDREPRPMQQAAEEPAGQGQQEDWAPEDQQR